MWTLLAAALVLGCLEAVFLHVSSRLCFKNGLTASLLIAHKSAFHSFTETQEKETNKIA